MGYRDCDGIQFIRIKKLLGLLVGEVNYLSTQQVNCNGLISLLDQRRADVIVADQVLNFNTYLFSGSNR
jgi:hypothetical protein